MSTPKKILLNLDTELHEQIATAAERQSLSVTEWVRRAIKAKLEKPESAEPDLFSVQSSDKTAEEYWLEKIRQWAGMPGAEAMAKLDAATGGKRPPLTLFGSAPALAKWLTENATRC